MGNLTITPQRLKEVDFSKPAYRDVSEVVVTGPASKPIPSKEDSPVRRFMSENSSSYYESLEALNADLAGRKKAPVKIRLAPESLEDEDLLEMVNAGLVKATIVDSHIGGFLEEDFSQDRAKPRRSRSDRWGNRLDVPKTALNSRRL